MANIYFKVRKNKITLSHAIDVWIIEGHGMTKVKFEKTRKTQNIRDIARKFNKKHFI